MHQWSRFVPSHQNQALDSQVHVRQFKLRDPGRGDDSICLSQTSASQRYLSGPE
jgi:hypothetical protein